MSFPNRLATESEELVVHRFRSGAKGLAAVSDLQRVSLALTVRRKSLRSLLSEFCSRVGEIFAAPNESKSVPAVCIPPGAHLLLRDIPQQLQDQLGVRRVEEVTFTEITSSEFSYRDAVCFQNGIETILQRLQEGQRVRVLNLSLADTASPQLEILAPAA